MNFVIDASQRVLVFVTSHGLACREHLGREALSSFRPRGTWVQENVLEFSGIRIFVKTITSKCLTVNVQRTDRIEDVKAESQELSGLASHCQRLIFAGKQLNDDNTLQDYSIQDRSTLLMVLRGSPDHGYTRER